MRPVSYTLTGENASPVYAPDHYVSPFNVALAVRVTGTANYTVQYTFDDVFAKNYNPATGNWTNHPTLAGDTTSEDSNIAYPVRGIRLTTTSATTGTATLTIIQAGGGGLA
jgi:hypothetical protein